MFKGLLMELLGTEGCINWKCVVLGDQFWETTLVPPSGCQCMLIGPYKTWHSILQIYKTHSEPMLAAFTCCLCLHLCVLFSAWMICSATSCH